MTVIVIIAVLVAIAVPIYTITIANTEEKLCQSNQRTIEGAVDMWLIANDDHKIEDVSLDKLQYWLNDPAPLCPLGNASYTFDGNGHVICPNRHDHY